MEIAHSTIVTPLSGTHTSPSPAHLSANRITLLFCSCLLIGRNWNVKHPPSGQSWVGPIGRYTTGLFWSRGLGHVPGSVWWRHRGISDTVTCFIRKCIEDVVPTKTIRIYPNQKPWINSDVRSALSAWTSAFKSGNTDDRKQASLRSQEIHQSSQTTIQKQSWRTFQQQQPKKHVAGH